MLARLEGALGCSDLTRQMLLVPPSGGSAPSNTAQEVTLMVAYNGSPRSQIALDLTLWIAHQTRLATSKAVTVQVVYVMDLQSSCSPGLSSNRSVASKSKPFSRKKHRESAPLVACGQAAVQPRPNSIAPELTESCQPSVSDVSSCWADSFEQADRILWRARYLADEWRGSLKTHLRFGDLIPELKNVVQAESATMLIVGCESAEHPLVRQLGRFFPCPVVGIPPALSDG
ncbi:universal stress protein [Pantanalinema sp. GBBB05]|uniref:universal stress protein n=1 Tax=Pantanalinema sp. GBBB05 TaxID=2604139 RepID=UPI001D6D3D7C|nr:universal stress protein [Pantanalinema sp. GBBB05]